MASIKNAREGLKLSKQVNPLAKKEAAILKLLSGLTVNQAKYLLGEINNKLELVSIVKPVS